MIALALWLGVGGGLVAADALDNGVPGDWRSWLDWALCPVLWPLAVYRRLR